MMDFLRFPIAQKALYSLLIIALAVVLTQLIVRFINRRVEDLKRRHSARKNTIYLITFLTMVVVIVIWAQAGPNLVTIFGIVGAGLTLALHQPVLSIAGWLLLLVRRPYETGDRVEIGSVKGDVIDIRLFYTSLLEIGNWVDADQSTGRVVNCPNNKVFTEPIFNYTRGFEYVWHEIKITVTFESDWKKARRIIDEIASMESLDLGEQARRKIQRMSHKVLIHYGKLTPIVWTRIVDFGVELTLRYLTDARRRRSTENEICCEVLDRFGKEPDVELAYPTYRIYRRGEPE